MLSFSSAVRIFLAVEPVDSKRYKICPLDD